MSIQQLQAMGLMASNPLVKRDIKIKYFPLKEGSETEREEELVEGIVTVWLKKFTAADKMEMARADSQDEKTFLAIQRTVYTEDGKHLFPDVEMASQLDLVIYGELLLAINDVNGDLTKKSLARTNGGASSPLPSVGAPSRSGKRRSLKKNKPSGSSTGTSTDP